MAVAKGQPRAAADSAKPKPSARSAPKARRGARAAEPAGRADPTTDPAGYEVDFYLWAYTQADLLRSGRYAQLDLPNLIEELETLGRSDKRALASAYRVLIMHLLNWQFQPQKRTRSWESTIRQQRRAIASIEKDSPTLRKAAAAIATDVYALAREDAAAETRLDLSIFPIECPYQLAMLRDVGALPDDTPEGMTTP